MNVDGLLNTEFKSVQQVVCQGCFLLVSRDYSFDLKNKLCKYCQSKRKQCSKCKKWKIKKEDFHLDSGKLDGLYSYCKSCNSEHVQKWKMQQPEYGLRVKLTEVEKRLRSLRGDRIRKYSYKDILDGIKATKGCKNCGFKDSRALDWHHVDPTQKIENISTMLANKRSLTSILEETKKCEVLCRNCHSILHAEETEKLRKYA